MMLAPTDLRRLVQQRPNPALRQLQLPGRLIPHQHAHPDAAFGNAVGDQQMLEWTQAGGGARLMILVHHDDAEREWAYGAESKIGTFSDAFMADAKQ